MENRFIMFLIGVLPPFLLENSIFTSFFWFFAIRRTSHIDSIVQSKILLGRLHFGNNYKNQVHLND